MSYRSRAQRNASPLLMVAAAAAALGFAVAALPADQDPLRELPAQPASAVSAAFTHPGPQVIYAAP